MNQEGQEDRDYWSERYAMLTCDDCGEAIEDGWTCDECDFDEEDED